MKENIVRCQLQAGYPENKTPHPAPDLFAGHRGLPVGFRMAGLERDCYAIAAVQTRRSANRPGGVSDVPNIIIADDRNQFRGQNNKYGENKCKS